VEKPLESIYLEHVIVLLHKFTANNHVVLTFILNIFHCSLHVIVAPAF